MSAFAKPGRAKPQYSVPPMLIPIRPTRASLTPQNAEAVICTQDWIHKGRVLTSEEEYDLVQ
ncbi:hypothetical protein OROHE_005637 [Orobanche hederae]